MLNRVSANRFWVGTLVAMLFISFLGTLGFSQEQKPTKEEITASLDENIKALLKQRVELLQKVVRASQAEFEMGKVNFARIAEVRRDLLKATLELTEESAKRIAMLEDLQKDMDALVKTVKARFDAGQTTGTDFFHAQVLWLEIRIELLREHKKVNAQRKN